MDTNLNKLAAYLWLYMPMIMSVRVHYIDLDFRF